MKQQQQQKRESIDSVNCSLLSIPITTPGISDKTSEIVSYASLRTTEGRDRKKKKPKRVSIVQTPVRAKPLTPGNMKGFKMFASSHANQKINGLDPELVGMKHQRYDGQKNAKNNISEQQQKTTII